MTSKMKKTYIIPNTLVMQLNAQEHIMDGSAKMSGDVSDVTYGGRSEGGMQSDTKSNDWDIW